MRFTHDYQRGTIRRSATLGEDRPVVGGRPSWLKDKEDQPTTPFRPKRNQKTFSPTLAPSTANNTTNRSTW